MEVYTGDSDSPTKHQKHFRNSGVAIGAIISKNIIYPSLLLPSSSLGNHEYSPCLHEFFTVPTEISFFTYNPHCAMSFLLGGLVVPFIRPSAIIQHSHLIRKCFLYGLLMPITTGWHKYVHQPGICSTSTPRACISFTTDAIIWHL